MFIQWLKRLFTKDRTGAGIVAGKTSPALPAPKKAAGAASGQPSQAPAHSILDDLVLDIAPVPSLFKVASESIDIAQKTRDAEVFALRLRAASDRLALVEHHCRKYGEQLAGADQARHALDALMARGPLSSGSTTKGKPRARRKKKANQGAAVEHSGALRMTGRPDIPLEFSMSPWLSSIRTDESGARMEKFRSDMRRDALAGQAWTDQAKQAETPEERLQIALRMLPLPAAFREAARAVRSMIRTARKENQPVDRQLELLYWLAAVASFSVPYAARSRQPGFNVMEVGSGAEIVSLPFAYDDLGYARLELLTATDRKAIAANWGEPARHSTLNELHADLWERYEDLSVRVHDRRLKRLLEQL